MVGGSGFLRRREKKPIAAVRGQSRGGARTHQRWRGLSSQPEIDGRKPGLRSVVDAEFGVEMLDVVARRLVGDVQFGRDLPVRVPPGRRV